MPPPTSAGMTPWRFRVVLVTAFFFMAAVHVIHQGGYVADSYRDKRPEPRGQAGFSRGIAYGFPAASLLVLATFKSPAPRCAYSAWT